jgi:CRP-like cAMP-binding protein
MKRTQTYSSNKPVSAPLSKRIENKSLHVKKTKKEKFLSSEREIIDFRDDLNNFHPELENEQKIKELLLYIKTLNGINPLIEDLTCHISHETRAESFIILKKMAQLLDQINIFFFYFKHYKIDDKIIRRILPNFKYKFYHKDELVFKEGESSTRFYFLVKGKISLKKKVYEHKSHLVEKMVLNEGAHFGESDIIYNRKKKLSAFCLENSLIISVDKETFKEFFETKIIKREAEIKTMLKNFLMRYMTLPAIKIERFIQNNIETLFFKRNEVIYREGDNNSYLYMVNDGEANLVQNLNKGEYSYLLKYQYSTEYIKDMAIRIDYKGVIKSAYQKICDSNKNAGDNYSKNLIQEKNKELSYYRKGFNKNKKENELDNINKSESLKLDLLLERSNFQIISNLKKGSLGGLEICTGITKFKYSLITGSDFTSIFKIDLNQLEGQHLTELLLNLLPSFIDSERKMHLQLKKMRYIDSNILPEACQKFHKKNNSDSSFYQDEENDDVYKRRIIKIDNMFQFNEGGFIKMNDYNMKLHKKKYQLKEKLKENIRKDNKTELFLKSYNKEQNSKLKFKGVNQIKPVIPKYEIIDYKCDKVNNTKNNNENDLMSSNIFCDISNGKNSFYLIDKNILSGKIQNKSKHKNKSVISRKSQEMFDKLFLKPRRPKSSLFNRRVLTLNLHKFKNKKFDYKKYFIDNNDYMRDLCVKKNQDIIHCYNKNFIESKINQFSKNVIKKPKKNKTSRTLTLSHNLDVKKMTFYNSGRYDIPLLTELNSFDF